MNKEEKNELDALAAENAELVARLSKVQIVCKKAINYQEQFLSGKGSLGKYHFAKDVLQITGYE